MSQSTELYYKKIRDKIITLDDLYKYIKEIPDLNNIDDKGRTIIFYLPRFFKQLIELGAKTDIIDKEHKNLMFYCITDYDIDIIASKGVSTNHTDIYGKKPYEYCFCINQIEGLLKNKAIIPLSFVESLKEKVISYPKRDEESETFKKNQLKKIEECILKYYPN